MASREIQPPPLQSPPSAAYTFKCVCLIQNDGCTFRSPNPQSKFSTVSLILPDRITVSEFGKKQVIAEYSVAHLRMVHKKFIDQGKLTVQIFSGSRLVIPQTAHMSLSGPLKQDYITCLLISNSIKETLDIFVTKLLAMAKNVKQQVAQLMSSGRASLLAESIQNNSNKKDANREQQQQGDNKKSIKSIITKNPRLLAAQRAREQEENEERNKRAVVGNMQKKITPTTTLDTIQTVNVQHFPGNPILAKVEQKSSGQTNQLEYIINAVQPTRLWDLPRETFAKIVEYSGFSLAYRVVSKDFSQMLLQQIKCIKLHPQIQEPVFKKLTAYARRIECRMKLIKDLSHFRDNETLGVLNQNNAKTLKFGTWRQVTPKSVCQLRNTRIYRLELPYSMKVASQHLLPLKLVYLKLKTGNNSLRPNRKNELINDEDLIQLINKNEQMTSLQTGYSSTALLEKLEKKQKMKILKIETLEVKKGYDWKNLTAFSNLETLAICHLNNSSAVHSVPLQLPAKLRKLKLGTFVDRVTLFQLPQSLQKLTLLSEQLVNDDIREITLPNLKELDVRQCPMLTHLAFAGCVNLIIYTRWSDLMVINAENYLAGTGIRIINEKP